MTADGRRILAAQAFRAVGYGFPERASFVYDALYAWCARQVEAPVEGTVGAPTA